MLSPAEIRGFTTAKASGSSIPVSRDSQLRMSGEILYEKLIQPLESMIYTKNLTIVPHGALHYLPFNALNSGGEYLIDRYSIRILPSASVMQFLKDRREGHAGNLLAFGNPDLGDPTYDLPGAQNEAIAITKDQTKSKLLLRNQATETAVKQYGAGFRYLHFAVHGIFDAEKPLSSGLLLSGDDENDGTLSVGELYDLYLPADLVTLSACETALGEVANGDDVVGFTRGFLYAGTSSIISSLWKVDDKATSILMQQFYKSLEESDKRSALRTAQLKIKDNYNSHPYFWAAFQITGSVQ
jgi:CHAT domain-containing protein